MAFFNYVTKEITLKIVYYGPGLSGKTTNLQHLYSILDPSRRGKFLSLSTESDRTLFFDFLPVELGKIKDFTVRFQLYTVPGQIRYNATRKLVLKGADAVVFVADSQRDMKEQNVESLTNMSENLAANNLNPDDIPTILQYNKRDLPHILPVEELDRDLNKKGYQSIEAVAVNGTGVQDTFRLITKLLLKDISRKHKVDIASPLHTEGQVQPSQKHDEAPLAEAHHMAEGGAHAIFPEPPAPHPPASSDGQLRILVETLAEMKQSLEEIRKTLSVVYGEVNKAEKRQADMLVRLSEMGELLSSVTEKRRRGWFRFIS